MFDQIASKYDFANNFLSFGIYKYWRKKTINQLKSRKPEFILDLATGTGDIAIALTKLNPKKIIGVDNSKEMLKVGIEKISKKGLSNLIEMKYGDSENIPLADRYVDACTIAYGVRNFENLEKALSEVYRVLKIDSKVVILEFSNPKNKFFKSIYNWYFKKVLPNLGKLITGSKYAYNYLPDSVEKFPDRENFVKILDNAGFKNASFKELTFGVACLYTGEKF